jgi:hypothetical protein
LSRPHLYVRRLTDLGGLGLFRFLLLLLLLLLLFLRPRRRRLRHRLAWIAPITPHLHRTSLPSSLYLLRGQANVSDILAARNLRL